MIGSGGDPFLLLGSSFLGAAFLTQECMDLNYREINVVPQVDDVEHHLSRGAAWLALRTCRSFNRCLERCREDAASIQAGSRGQKVHRREQLGLR